jgi:hypothetical protein
MLEWISISIEFDSFGRSFIGISLTESVNISGLLMEEINQR